MLAKSEIVDLLQQGQSDPEKGIGITPNPLPNRESQIGSASLDLRLGRWFLVLHQSRRSEINLRKTISTESGDVDGRYFYVPFGQRFVIHPNRFVLAVTLEWLRLPSDLGGYILGKSSLGRRGLIIETAAGIQPSFSGCLTLELFNCGEVPISVEPGMRISQVFFHRVSGSDESPQSHHHGRRRPVFGSYNFDVHAPKREGQLFP